MTAFSDFVWLIYHIKQCLKFEENDRIIACKVDLKELE